VEPDKQYLKVKREMKFLSEIGKDTTMAPYEEDFKKLSPRLTTLFNYQPRVIRILAPRTDTLAFDGLTEHVTARVKKMKRPEYAMDPENSNVKLQGDRKSVYTPQIFQSVSLLNDAWKATFAGHAKVPLQVAQMLENVKQEENLIGLQGRGIVLGLISSETTKLADPTSTYGTDASGDGILEVAQAGFEEVLDKFDEVGVGHLAVDWLFTPPLMRLLKNTIVPYDPNTNNLDILLNKCPPGSSARSTGDLQDGYTKGSNTFFAQARTGESDAAWELLSSGLEQKVKEDGLWKTEMGIREKFSLKVLRKDMLYWRENIDTIPP
jgi:hypothetical protein